MQEVQLKWDEMCDAYAHDDWDRVAKAALDLRQLLDSGDTPIVVGRDDLGTIWRSPTLASISCWNESSSETMPERRSKRKLPRDVNQREHAIGEMATYEAAPEPQVADDGKNPAAVALGRLGGLKGGKARAAKLSKGERSASAKKAARARWSKFSQ